MQMRFLHSLPSLHSAFRALLIITVCAASCKRDGNKTGAMNPASTAAVKAQLDILSDSVEVKWKKMTESDDQKIAVTRLLLRDLEKVPGANSTQLQALSQANAHLPTRRYTQLTMSDSGLIDRYDTAQDSLLKALYPVAAPNGNAPTENARNLIEGIQELDAGVVSYRIQYDRAAKTYNNYLKLHQTEIQSLGGKYAELKTLPLFELPQ